MKLVLALSFLFSNTSFANAQTLKSLDHGRTSVKIPAAQRARFKDISQSLRMAELTPIVNANDEVICMEISAIKDKVLETLLKAKVGDCFSQIRVFKREASGGTSSEVHSVLSLTDAMTLYQELVGANRVDVDFTRKVAGKKTFVLMSYLMD